MFNYAFTLTEIYISFTFTAFGRSFYPEQRTEVLYSLHWKHIPILSSKNPVRVMLVSVRTSTKTVKLEGFFYLYLDVSCDWVYCSTCGKNGLNIFLKMFNATLCVPLTVHSTKTRRVECVHLALLNQVSGSSLILTVFCWPAWVPWRQSYSQSLADADAVWRNVAESTSGSWNASGFICSGFNAITSAQAHKEGFLELQRGLCYDRFTELA